MRIAFVVPYVPNLIRTRPYNLIVHLTALGHKVDVFTLGSQVQDVQDAQAIQKKSEMVHYYKQPVWRSMLNSALAVPSKQPLQSVYSWQDGMARDLARRVSQKEFDVVHVEHLRGSRYGKFLKSRFPKMPVVWDSVDCISNLFQQASSQSQGFFGRIITRLELPRTRFAEGNLVCDFDHVLVTSSVDKRKLLELVPKNRSSAPISVLSNGVDFGYFHPEPDIQHEPDTLVFSGKMSYHANIKMVQYFVAEILPRIWQKRKNVKLLVVGKDPSAEVRKLASHPLITVTGAVEDIRPYLWKATVAVVPLIYGAGIQNKILEAMATGLPVVTTPKAVSALDIALDKEILVAESPDEFAEKVLCLLKDLVLQSDVARAGLAYVHRNHSWNRIASQLVGAYEQAMTSS